MIRRAAGAGPTTRQRVREVFASRGFRRLFWTRILSQLGDGVFQLAAADLLLFEKPGPNPALTLTALAAVTLIPFSAIVPFVGVFIDRWDRRKILTYTPIARAVLATALPLTVIGGDEGPAFYAVVLVVLSANRLFLATISAVLPQLVPEDDLLVANSVATTGGSVAHGIGLASGAALSAVLGGTRAGLIAGAAFATTALLARALPVHRGLEPVKAPLAEELREVLRDLVDGIRRVRRSARATYALSAIGSLQVLVGAMSAVATVVFITRLGLGVGAVTRLLFALPVGIGLGVVLVPIVARRVRHDLLVPIAFGIGGVAVLASSASLTRDPVVAAAVFIGISYAFAKIPVDTIVQEEMPDAFRGRAFSVYDMLFNVARVAGTGIAAAAIEVPVRLERIVLLIGICYLFASTAFGLWARRIGGVERLPPPSVLFPVGELVTVRSYAGYRADEEPRVLVVGGREVPVDAIEWRAVEERAGERRRIFVVRVGGVRVRLAHSEAASRWEVDRILPVPPEGPP